MLFDSEVDPFCAGCRATSAVTELILANSFSSCYYDQSLGDEWSEKIINHILHTIIYHIIYILQYSS